MRNLLGSPVVQITLNIAYPKNMKLMLLKIGQKVERGLG